MEHGFFKFTNITSSTTTPPVHVKSSFEGKGDPGYLLTSSKHSHCVLFVCCLSYILPVMLAEAAICLLDTSDLPELARGGGILTPMTALGDKYLQRLEDTGRFSFHSEIVFEGETKKTR